MKIAELKTFVVGNPPPAFGGRYFLFLKLKTACASFWRSLDFKAATVMASSIFLLGDAVGHVKQMMVAGNFAPGNAGVPFYSDIAFPLMAMILLMIVRRSQAAERMS